MPLDGNERDYDKPAVVSLDGLIAWLRTQDPATKYAFTDILDCLLCRYGRANGVDVHSADDNSIFMRDRNRHEVFPAGADIAADFPWTYGAALERALAYRSRHEPTIGGLCFEAASAAAKIGGKS